MDAFVVRHCGRSVDCQSPINATRVAAKQHAFRYRDARQSIASWLDSIQDRASSPAPREYRFVPAFQVADGFELSIPTSLTAMATTVFENFGQPEIAPVSPNEPARTAVVAVVIPCYRVEQSIADVINRIGPEVALVICVDDGCPAGSGQAAQQAADNDPRVRILRHEQNMGVGAAVVTGYKAALALGADIIVKLDGDGQMAPEKIGDLIELILRGEADYLKGNRFFNLEDLRLMPRLRVLGNTGLSFLSKLSSGYWNLFDPTNGFTAIHATTAALLPLNKLSKRYFFESDTLFRLNVLRAVVLEVPMTAHYAGEHSSLSISKTVLEFPFLHLRNLFKRIFYNYFLRDFNMASINLVMGTLLLLFGIVFGSVHWIRGYAFDVLASPGTVMLAALPVILGSQLMLSFINFDLANVPQRPLQRILRRTIQSVSPLRAASDIPRSSNGESPR